MARSRSRSTTRRTTTPRGRKRLNCRSRSAARSGRNEDVDWYAIEAQGKQTVTFRIWGNRLENKIHDLQTHFDPILVLCDASGRELAADDNHEFADPLLIYTLPDAGRYLLQVRDTTYSGNPNWTYVLEATAGPFASAV